MPQNASKDLTDEEMQLIAEHPADYGADAAPSWAITVTLRHRALSQLLHMVCHGNTETAFTALNKTLRRGVLVHNPRVDLLLVKNEGRDYTLVLHKDEENRNAFFASVIEGRKETQAKGKEVYVSYSSDPGLGRYHRRH